MGTSVSRNNRSNFACGLACQWRSLAASGASSSGAGGEALDEHEPRCLPCLGRELPDTVGRPQRLVVLRQDNFECRKILGKRRPRRGWVMRSVGSQPSTCLRERREVADLRDQVVVRIARQAGQEPLMVWGDVAIDLGLGRQQRGDRHDEPHRLHVAEPFEMRQVFGIIAPWCYPVTGQR